MEHIKTYHGIDWPHPRGLLRVEGPVSPEALATYRLDDGLGAFRPPARQHEALVEIAALPEGRVIVARRAETVVGYVTFHYPDPFERWAQGGLDCLLELGAIEVTPLYRKGGLAKTLLRVAFLDDFMENYIVLTTEYYWHWDLKGTGLDVWAYRRVMEKVMGSAGLVWMATDDPDICAHPANCLMVRIGKNVPPEAVAAFDRLRFQNRLIW